MMIKDYLESPKGHIEKSLSPKKVMEPADFYNINILPLIQYAESGKNLTGNFHKLLILCLY